MKIKNKKIRKSMNKGVTLIALVITITILLILAGISIVALTGDNGLINRAAGAKDATEIAQEKEILQQASVVAMGKSKTGDVEKAYLDAELDKNPGNSKYSSNSTSNGIEVTFTGSKRSYLVDTDGNVTKITVMPTVANVPKTAVTENTKYVDPNGDTAVIPEGFKVINNEDQPEIDDGLVVQDGANNEWVWIPVPDASVMYTHVDEGIAITGGSGYTYVSGVTTNYYSKSDIISGITRGLPNTFKYREPDVVTYIDGTEYDAVEANYSAAGFTSLQNMAQSLVDDYEEMIASVEKNKGFYVGRYELSGSVTSPTEQGDKTPLAEQNWYNLYKACKGFIVEGVVESRMIWGCQWDMIMKWMLSSDNTEIQTYVTNSTGKGNYGGDSGNRINTGSNSSYEVNGIFDLAGNCCEWTQEAYYSNSRATRGRWLR